MDEHAGESKEEEVTGEGISRDGFEDSMYKAKAIGFRGQGQGHWFSRPRPRPPKAKASDHKNTSYP